MDRDVEMKDVKIALVFILGFILGIMCMYRVMTAGINTYHTIDTETMVSYEYTTQCRCGGTIEGYHSLVDGFNQEECSKCGYHKEDK